MITLPSVYLGPSSYYKLLTLSNSCCIEHHEHFIKQSFRNRCYLASANGQLSMSIPLKKWKNHTPIHSIEISYEDNWQKLHWKSIVSAYSATPYFEFYEEEFRPFYESKNYNRLIDFNQEIQNKVMHLIKLQLELISTTNFEQANQEWTIKMHPKNKTLFDMFHFPKYIQVFEDKYDFISNLSIIDVLFNLGPQTIDYLNAIEFKNIPNG